MKRYPKSKAEKDRMMAQRCLQCTACRHARKKQRGLIFWIVKKVERKVCPYCEAYHRIFGRFAHEPLPDHWPEEVS